MLSSGRRALNLAGRGVVPRNGTPRFLLYELGDASVPFRFDVHCLFFSEDAVTLEAELHQHFASRRVNHVNLRREYFFASPGEVGVVLASKVGSLLEFTEHAESAEYLQSLHYWPAQYRGQR